MSSYSFADSSIQYICWILSMKIEKGGKVLAV